MACFPIFVELKKCLVVGGGKVALRKTRTLRDFGAEITVVSPDFCDGLTEMQGITLKKKKFSGEDLAGQNLVFSAVDDAEANAEILRLCREKGIPANSAARGDLGDFFFPSVIRDGDLVIGVSTSGKSPAFAKIIRQKILSFLPANLGRKLEEISRIRDESLGSGRGPLKNPEYKIELEDMEKMFC